MTGKIKKINQPDKTILLVEDEQALQEAIKLKLEKEGIGVMAVSSGEDAVNYLKKSKPDLVWLDVLLPGMNGLEVLRKIREEFKMQSLPVVVISVSAGQDKIKQALSLGAADYIIKSGYNLGDIISRVKKYLK